MIPDALLKKYSAILVNYQKDAVIFEEGDEALNFFQIGEGSVKMISRSDDGQEFIQGISDKGESFGEPPLLCNFRYPSTALAIEKSKIWKMRKEVFFVLIKENFDVHLKLDQMLCERLRYKNKTLASIAFDNPETRVLNLIDYLKSKSRSSHHGRILIPLTRQQMADMTGMRVETVIRTVKKLEDTGKLRLQNHKILA